MSSINCYIIGHKIRPAYDFDYVALDLLTIYPEDSGIYTCHARNAYGEAQTSATIKVQGKQFSKIFLIWQCKVGNISWKKMTNMF